MRRFRLRTIAASLRARLPLALRRRLARMCSYLSGGGRWRERILLGLLKEHYRQRFRRQWRLVDIEHYPHFTDQRIAIFTFAFGDTMFSHQFFNRAIFAAEVLRPGDRVLDIGCGDGYLTRRFLAGRCAHVDAIDIEPESIRTARRDHPAANICYSLRDAVKEPFPAERYDAVVWDGAIGHFSAQDTQIVLTKIARVLAADGVFVGSESLGDEGWDHQQFFDKMEEMAALFHPLFPKVELRRDEFTFCYDTPFKRQEVYWRCSRSEERLRQGQWLRFSSPAATLRAGGSPAANRVA